jgi:hypothetical protein
MIWLNDTGTEARKLLPNLKQKYHCHYSHYLNEYLYCDVDWLEARIARQKAVNSNE